MTPPPPFDVRRLAKLGAGWVFARAVDGIYRAATGETPTGPPARLIERLVKEERLTPEAALHLVAIARALKEGGIVLADLSRTIDWKAHAQRIVPGRILQHALRRE